MVPSPCQRRLSGTGRAASPTYSTAARSGLIKIPPSTWCARRGRRPRNVLESRVISGGGDCRSSPRGRRAGVAAGRPAGARSRPANAATRRWRTT